ncbi:TIGR03936 family radical SAM-associated protein [Tuwongella immobilis]|uniref:DUF2344 domain-containing protein n=1 Tax=Tuwongella immobilis TaxID=692036 RepID=A0A6C2YNH8_9BACT|nr:TIGR03936 family radical SAM-associated protein [Tuwongella immobilis]VIP02944.1 Fe-S oxidoreductase OS=uncultured planctomycete GN=HGMM_F07G10C16 PE=4 SV=1: DUF2344 [Tuwongella immobilis]VTS02920.1 Fe-S oxidoreductase OS=uncultured planctomycete GN=HGMM_F07G10C16 PE=4 SV=1: DUF2344 [Tuwongella immobilis]
MDRAKVRIRFRKSGDLRLVSHLDLMRCFERMLRRAGIPFRSTEGFHPQPRMVFALSLPLGIVGLREVVEVELTEPVEPELIEAKLVATAPPGIEILSVHSIPGNRTGQVRQVRYRLPLAATRVPIGLADRITELLSRAQIWVQRVRPQRKLFNIRPFVHSVWLESNAVGMDLWVTGSGTAKAEELLAFLHLRDELSAGAVLERVDVEIFDEVDAPTQAATPDPEMLRQLASEGASSATAEIDLEREPLAPVSVSPDMEWGASPNGPVVQ